MTTLAAIPWKTLTEVSFGPVTIRTFGVLVALGIVVGRAVTRRVLATSDVDLDELDGVLFRSIGWGLVGARLAWVATHLDEVDSVIDVVAVWDGGLQFSGGFLVAVLVAVPWLRRQDRGTRRLVADGAALGLAPGLAIGRLGCVAVGEHLGGVTTFPLATRYLGGDVIEGPLVVGVAYHNTAVYELLHLAVLTALFAVLHRRGTLVLGDGRSAALFLGWYAFWRSITDLTRTADADLLGLTGAQWIALVVLLPAAVALWRRATRIPDAGDRVTTPG